MGLVSAEDLCFLSASMSSALDKDENAKEQYVKEASGSVREKPLPQFGSKQKLQIHFLQCFLQRHTAECHLHMDTLTLI